ncbi:MAG: hypothetical protein WB341_14030 [Terracidiphilus sp.]
MWIQSNGTTLDRLGAAIGSDGLIRQWNSQLLTLKNGTDDFRGSKIVDRGAWLRWQNRYKIEGMSTELFMGVRPSYAGKAQESATAFLEAMNRVLVESGVEPYADSDETPRVYTGYLFGRSALDHDSSRVFVEIADLAQASRSCPNLALIRDNPHRVAFVPRRLLQPLATGYHERIEGNNVQIWIGSLAQLTEELLHFARDLRIPLSNGGVADETADFINMFTPFHERDSTKLIRDYRPAWLALYEGARLAMEHGVALTLAG